MTQPYNAQLIDQLATDFPKRLDSSYAWGQTVSGIQLTRNLRALWGCGSIDENNKVLDLSGQGRVLMPGTVPNFGAYGIAPYLDFVRASSMYLKRPTEPGIEITTGLTVWTWVYFDAQSTGGETDLLSKWYTTGNKRSYLLYKSVADAFTFDISTDGAAVTSIGDAVANYLISKWWFIAGRFTPSTELALFVGQATSGQNNWYLNAVAPATIFISPEALEIGRGNRTNYLDGRITLPGLAAEALTDVEVWNIFSQTRPLLI